MTEQNNGANIELCKLEVTITERNSMFVFVLTKKHMNNYGGSLFFSHTPTNTNYSNAPFMDGLAAIVVVNWWHSFDRPVYFFSSLVLYVYGRCFAIPIWPLFNRQYIIISVAIVVAVYRKFWRSLSIVPDPTRLFSPVLRCFGLLVSYNNKYVCAHANDSWICNAGVFSHSFCPGSRFCPKRSSRSITFSRT